jgi:hypothetical protein
VGACSARSDGCTGGCAGLGGTGWRTRVVETTPEHITHDVVVAVFRLRGGAAEERSEVAPDSASKLDGERK